MQHSFVGIWKRLALSLSLALSHSLTVSTYYVPFVSVCICARTYKYFYYTAFVSHWLAIPNAYDTASGCMKLHMFRIQITRYYEFMVKMLKTIYSLWKWMWCTLLNLSHFNIPILYSISLRLFGFHWSYSPFVCILQTSKILLCTSNRLILLKHHHSYDDGSWFYIKPILNVTNFSNV